MEAPSTSGRVQPLGQLNRFQTQPGRCPFTGPVELGRCAGFDLGGPCRRVGLILGL